MYCVYLYGIVTGIVLYQLTINRWHLVKIACNNSGCVCDISTML